MCVIATNERGADGDGRIEVAREVDVADHAAIEASASGLEVVDDRHRAGLRRTRQRAGREGRDKGIECRSVRLERPHHGRDQVHHMGVALDLHELHDLNRSGETHAPEVVAPEVHEHEVLRTLLLVGQETLDKCRILLGCRATRARPRDGMHAASTFVHRDQRLRR